MRSFRALKATVLGLFGFAAIFGASAGCQTVNDPLAAMPLATITAVQLFDQPNYTVALSVQSALNNPSLVSTINWVFGDGTGFVAGPAGKTTISHKYASTGTFPVTAYVFQATTLAATINSTVTVAENGSGGSSTPVGPLPGMITGPNPKDKATDVAVLTKLTWTSGTGATSHDVYLGEVEADVTAATPSSADYEGTITVASYDPGGLTAETKYFWRIDERNAAGVTKGTVLSFTTAKAPTKAKDFVPVNGVTTAPVAQVLQWTAGKNTTSHDVYFGKDLAAVANATKDTVDIFKGNQSGTSYDPSDAAAAIDGQLLASTQYFWRIDEVGLGGTAKGDVQEFRTIAPPEAVTSPIPANGAGNVDVGISLEWSAVPAITSFDVYLGTDTVAVANATHSNAEFKSNITSKTFTPGTLLGGTIYFWRVDTLGPGGTSKGVVFTFTTATPPAQVAGPFTPLNNATNVIYTADLMWALGAGGGTTLSFDVYFGTSQTAVANGQAAALKGNLDVSNTTFDPNDLSPDTQYYWRIDSVGPGGKTAGSVLTFRVGALPGQVGNAPTPANGAKGIPLDQQLGWIAGAGAVQHDVYFGTDQTAVTSATVASTQYKGRQAGTTFNPGLLEGNTTYYWRIDETSPGGATKGPIWSFTTVPGRAINPDPMNLDTGIALDVQLSWTAGSGAVSHDVYFGTVETDVLNATHATATIFKGNQPGTAWTPPSLLAGVTDYYWRIDEVGAPVNGMTKGLVWKFTTGAGQAAMPVSPVNGATGVALSPTLTWHAGAGAASHDIYFGTSQTAVQNATTASPEYQTNHVLGVESFVVAGPLNGNTNYYWRIDELDTLLNVTKGSVWQFRTGTGPATAPTPENLALGVDINGDLSWTAGSGAASHNVYFGTVKADVESDTPPPAVSKGNQSSTTYEPGTLASDTTYYWRIDEVGPGGTTKGTVWEFKTGAGQATDPVPYDGEPGIDLAPDLQWTPDPLADTQDVYFGSSFTAVRDATTSSVESMGSFPNTTTLISVGPLPGMTWHYWRVDSVNPDGTLTKGAIWRFRTRAGMATAPSPANGVTTAGLNVVLSWTAGAGTVSHNVYFIKKTDNDALPAGSRIGDDVPDPTIPMLNQPGASLAKGPLTAATIYLWRVDEVAADGTPTKGVVWTFLTP